MICTGRKLLELEKKVCQCFFCLSCTSGVQCACGRSSDHALTTPPERARAAFNMASSLQRRGCAQEMAREANNLPSPSAPRPPSPEQEYDFIQDPPRDFFCAVTLFDLLLEPHQTGCCGHHLSREVVERLKRERKPCPMCQNADFETHPDLYLRRKVLELHVRCPYKAGGTGANGWATWGTGRRTYGTAPSNRGCASTAGCLGCARWHRDTRRSVRGCLSCAPTDAVWVKYRDVNSASTLTSSAHCKKWCARTATWRVVLYSLTSCTRTRGRKRQRQ